MTFLQNKQTANILRYVAVTMGDWVYAYSWSHLGYLQDALQQKTSEAMTERFWRASGTVPPSGGEGHKRVC